MFNVFNTQIVNSKLGISVKYCFDPKLHVWFCYTISKGVFRAHWTQIWGTSRLAFGGYMLVFHYQVYGEDRFPKLFSCEKLFVRFAKYQNAKRAHCTKSESTKVPTFCTDIRLYKCDCMSKKKKKKKKKVKILFRSKVTLQFTLSSVLW